MADTIGQQQPVLLASDHVTHLFPMPNGNMMTVLDDITIRHSAKGKSFAS